MRSLLNQTITQKAIPVVSEFSSAIWRACLSSASELKYLYSCISVSGQKYFVCICFSRSWLSLTFSSSASTESTLQCGQHAVWLCWSGCHSSMALVGNTSRQQKQPACLASRIRCSFWKQSLCSATTVCGCRAGFDGKFIYFILLPDF